MNKVAALAEARPQPTSAINLPDTQVNVGETFGFDSDMVVPAVLDQLVHGANVMGVRDSKLVAYAGWLRAPRAAAEAWIRGEPLPSPDWTAGDAAIITVFLADDPGDLTALIRGISHVCAGTPVFRMRVFNDSRPEKRRVPIQGRRQFPIAP